MKKSVSNYLAVIRDIRKPVVQGKVLQPAEFRYYRQRYLEVNNQKVIELFNDEELTDLTVVECE